MKKSKEFDSELCHKLGQCRWPVFVQRFRKRLYRVFFLSTLKLLRLGGKSPAWLFYGTGGYLEFTTQQDSKLLMDASVLSARIRHDGESLDSVSDLVRNWTSSFQVTSDAEIMFLMRLSRDFTEKGLFVAGYEFSRLAIAALGRRAETIPGIAGSVLGAKVAIQSGDAEKAQHFTQRLRRHFLLRSPYFYSLVAYVDIWVEGRTDVWFSGARDQLVRPSAVSGRLVQVIGKGPIGPDFLAQKVSNDVLVARVLTPNSEVSFTPSSVGPSRTDIAYVNGDTLQWLRIRNPSEVNELLEPLSEVAVKGGVPSFLRQAKPGKLREAVVPNVFLAGQANMLQVMALDFLAEGAKSVHVAGANFFLGAAPYRGDQFRTRSDGSAESPANIHESLRKALSSHNAWENWIFFENLFKAGRVRGDEYFEKALSQNVEEYLGQLQLSLFKM